MIGGPLLDPDTRAVTQWEESEAQVAVTTEAEVTELGAQNAEKISVQAAHNFSWILILLGLVPIFSGITGKGTYTHCLKFREKIKTIRV